MLVVVGVLFVKEFCIKGNHVLGEDYSEGAVKWSVISFKSNNEMFCLLRRRVS